MDTENHKTARALFDLVGPSYTLVWETSYTSLTDYESELNKVFSKKEWGEWYQKFIPNVERSYREIFTVFQ